MKKNKISFHDIPEYYNSVSFKRNDGVKGVLYYLCNTPSNEVKAEFETKFRNVQWMIAQSQYAPEQKKTCLFVFQ